LPAVIFANGELKDPQRTLNWVTEGDVIIAADGGSRHCLALGLVPDILIGDFDSLEPEQLAEFENKGCQIIRHPARKDYTDLELALRYACEHGMQDILVIGALGARWDQTLANLLLPAHPDLASARISLIDGPQEIRLIRPGEILVVEGRPGDTVSLIPLNENAAGVNTQGLEYPLVDEILEFGTTRGVSNVLLSERAEIILKQGMLLCILIRRE
jgi:thiamine pyrophosphokinase